MADPVTIGALAASALAIAAGEVVKTGVGEAVKDAYKNLKAKIAAWAGADVEALAAEPDSAGRQLIVAEKIDRQSPDELAEVRTLVLMLNDALREAAKAGAAGIDVGRLEAARVQLEGINVSDGVGFRAAEVKTTGDFTARDINVGKPKR
jgi:hypothetical protein